MKKNYVLLVCAAIGVIGLAILVSSRLLPPPPKTAGVQKDTTAPQVQITVPSEQLKAVRGSLPVTVHATDDRAVTQVRYQIDGSFVGISYASPFSISLDVSNLSSGTHTLTAIAYDQAGNTAQSQITFTISAVVAASPTPEPSSAPGTSGSSAVVTPRPTPRVSPVATPAATPTPPPPTSGDTTPPSVPSITGLTDPGNFHVHVTWSAASDNVAVTGYQIWRDGSLVTTTAGTQYDDAATIPGHTYAYQIAAYDAAGNHSALSTSANIVLSEATIFSPVDMPATIDTNDNGSIEVGVRFRPVVSGNITGVRFYKSAANTGTHVGNLWLPNGTNLATVTFTGESATGWQVAHFATPVHVTAGTTYVASYFAPNGHYASSGDYFIVDHTNDYLSGLADGQDGASGLYDYSGSSILPTSTFHSGNYWVDVLFSSDAPVAGETTRTCPAWPALPDASCTGVPAGTNLTTINGNLDITNDNTIIDGKDINGTVTVQGNNVIIKNSRIRQHIDARPAYQHGLIVEDSELAPTIPTISNFAPIDGTYTLLRTHIHSWQDGPHSSVGAVLIQDSISDDLDFQLGEHLDGFQQFAPGQVANVILDHDVISGCPGNDPDKGSSAMFWSDHPAAGSSFTAFHNSFSCGQYSIRVNDANVGSGVVADVHDNQVVKNSWGVGPYECGNSVVFNGTEGLKWSNNTYDDGTLIDFTGC